MKLVAIGFSLIMLSCELQASAKSTTIFSDATCEYMAHDGDQESWSDVCASLIDGINRDFVASRYSSMCSSWSGSDLQNDEKFHWLELSESKYLVRFRCEAGAYNESFIYFLVEPAKLVRGPRGQKRNAPPVVLFPNDPQLLRRSDLQKKWKLAESQAEVFARDFDNDTLTLRSLRKGLGDGSTGYYTEYRFDRSTGLPRLMFSATRILEDHKFGYSFERGKLPSGEGWLAFEPKSPVFGKTISLR